MGYYAYKPDKNGNEPLGTSGRIIITDLKTIKGVKNRCKSLFGDNFKLFSFSNFYNESTFKEIK